MEKVTYTPTPEIITSVQLVKVFDQHIYWLSTPKGKRVPIPSVTTQLSAVSNDFFPRWRGDLGNQEADQRLHQGSAQGTHIHYAAYIYTIGGAVVFDYPAEVNINNEWREEVRKTIEQCKIKGIRYYILREQEEFRKFLLIKAWKDIVKPIVHYSEVSMGSIEEFAAGTIDEIVELKETKSYADIAGKKNVILDAGFWINDFKSGFYDKVSVPMQVGEYMYLAEKNLGITCQGAIITHLKAQTGGTNAGLNTIVISREECFEGRDGFKSAQKLWLKQHPNWEPEVERFLPIAMRPEVEEQLQAGVLLPLPDEEKSAITANLESSPNWVTPKVGDSIVTQKQIDKVVINPKLNPPQEVKVPKKKAGQTPLKSLEQLTNEIQGLVGLTPDELDKWLNTNKPHTMALPINDMRDVMAIYREKVKTAKEKP